MIASAIRTKANDLMLKYGLIDNGWHFEWINAKRKFGHCDFRLKVIALSKQLTELNSEERMTNTILHEIAHALVGPLHGHDKAWKKQCIEIGAIPERCVTTTIDAVSAPSKYTGVCKNCGYEAKYHRKPKSRRACSKCCNAHNFGEFTTKYLLEIRQNY